MARGNERHGRSHNPYGSDPLRWAPYEIKIISDTTSVGVGDGQFIFVIPGDVDGLRLREAHAYVTGFSSSGPTTVSLYNLTTSHDMLSTNVTIDLGEYTSMEAAVQPVVNALYSRVAMGNRISVNVDVAGSGARGLGVILRFSQ